MDKQTFRVLVSQEIKRQLRAAGIMPKKRQAAGPNKKIQPGRIFQVNGGRSLNEKFITVTSIQDGFYFYVSDSDGIPNHQYSLMHSNIFSQEDLIYYGDRRIQKVRRGKYSWYLTGFKSIDVGMSLLDARYRFFRDNASPDLRAHYHELEDRNQHAETAMLVFTFTK